MKKRLRAGLMAGIIAGGMASASANTPRRIADLDWTAFQDERLGFALTFPARVFTAETGDPTEALKARTEKRSGRVFRSRDGRAYLQAAAFENIDRVGPQAYMREIARGTYGASRITFQRMGPDFFILSGNRNGEEFYERVTFSCGGRMINVWSMHYPVSERPLYDRIVEEIARTFRPAAGPGPCS